VIETETLWAEPLQVMPPAASTSNSYLPAPVYLPRGNWPEDTTWLLESFSNAYIPSHVFGPLDAVLIDHIQEGRSLAEVSRQANVPEEVGVPALKRLGIESAIFVRDGDNVSYSNVEHYLAMGRSAGLPVIRYLPPSVDSSRK
jgi:hypothetical protein